MEHRTDTVDRRWYDSGRLVNGTTTETKSTDYDACSCWTASRAESNDWSVLTVAKRLCVLRRARHDTASRGEEFARAISPHLPRSQADTLVAEVLPFLDACKFLERNAERLLRPRKLGRAGRPFWLSGVQAQVHREPLGHVLVMGPGNFPLFLPGTQVLQALVAGNRVTWKPGAGGSQVAELLGDTLRRSGLPDGWLRITDDSVESAQLALKSRPDKVVFTGSGETGRTILRELAENVTPAVMELSGADAVIVLPGADLQRVAQALAFGLRLNGAQVCMSPRRVFAEEETMKALKPLLLHELNRLPAVPVSKRTASILSELLDEAVSSGAEVLMCGDEYSTKQGYAAELKISNDEGPFVRPVIVDRARPYMVVTRSDLFAPVLSLIALRSMLEIPEAYAACPYALTVSIFCSRKDEDKARRMSRTLRAGTVLINDLIAPTADPRVPFGGIGESGFGVTRGAEGLLEMTTIKTILVRRGGTMRHLQPTTNADAPLMAGLIRIAHCGSWSNRISGLRAVVNASRGRGKQKRNQAA